MILVTGVAGFIGFSFAKKLLDLGYDVAGVDNINNYYSVDLKRQRLKILSEFDSFEFYEKDLLDSEFVTFLVADRKWDTIVHLAAQPGVRYSLVNPLTYIKNNIEVFNILLEAIRRVDPSIHLVYASSSSVYGNNQKLPYSEEDDVSNPASVYAMTKRANELTAITYESLYGIKSIGLRFFTVYGPYGRPDMAPYIFTDALFKGKEIVLFNNGKLRRDFTYIDDITSGIYAAMNFRSEVHEIFNLGNNSPVEVIEFLNTLEKIAGIKAEFRFEEMQKGDVFSTFADIEKSSQKLGFTPRTSLNEGLSSFVKWYQSYH